MITQFVDTDVKAWDKRAWLVGLIIPVLLIGVSNMVRYQPIASFLAIICPIAFWGDSVGGLIGDAASIAELLLFPGIVTAFAHRRAFLWGALPLCVDLISSIVFDIFRHQRNWFGAEFNIDQLIIKGEIWLVSSGVGLLVRGLLRKRVEKARRIAAEANAKSGNSIWPPAPCRME